MKPNSFELEILKEHFCGEELDKATERFENGEPLAYIIGKWYFYGLTFNLNSHCLIPRPDTEHTVEKAISLLPENGYFADLCTGSGCIAVSVLKHRADCMAEAYDISPEAVEIAKENAVLNSVSDSSLNIQVGDIFSLELPENKFDVIVSNPPYIKSDVIPTLETVKYEPKLALDGGGDGMRFYRHIVADFGASLKENGCFIFEIGYDQGEDIKKLALENGFSCEVNRDYGGNDRVAVLKRVFDDEKTTKA